MAEQKPGFLDDILTGITKVTRPGIDEGTEKLSKQQKESDKLDEEKTETEKKLEKKPSTPEVLREARQIDWLEIEKGDLIRFMYGSRGGSKKPRLLLVLDPLFVKKTKRGAVKMVDGLQISSGKIQDFGPQRIAALARMRLGNNYRTYDFNQLRRVICTLVYKLPPDLFHTIERFVEGRFGKRQPRIHPR
jgi:hypothetical protein|tara:strand:+ start:3387 stop:3956 length:570 start_codon:yes stop_codon:yes gene_type:complete